MANLVAVITSIIALVAVVYAWFLHSEAKLTWKIRSELIRCQVEKKRVEAGLARMMDVDEARKDKDAKKSKLIALLYKKLRELDPNNPEYSSSAMARSLLQKGRGEGRDGGKAGSNK